MPYFNPKKLKETSYANRVKDYKVQKTITNGDSYKLFEIPQLGGRQAKEDYYNPDIFKTVLELKQGLLFSQEIEVKFERPQLQDVFNDLNSKNRIIQKLQDGFLNTLIFGDAIFKFRYSKRKEAVLIDRILPENWIADYNENNVDEDAESNTILLEKTIKEKEDGQEKKYTLAETFTYNEKYQPIIVFEAFDNQDYKQVPVLQYFPELKNQLVDLKETNDLQLVKVLNTEDNIFFRYKNSENVGEYYGKADLSTPAIAMLKSLERKLNLIEYLAQQKVFPIIELEKDILTALKAKIQKDMLGGNLTQKSKVEEVDIASTDIASYPTRIDQTVHSRTIDNLAVYSQIQKSLIGVDGRKGVKTAYIVNPTSLDELREQIKANLDDLMQAFDVSKVYYRPDEISGQTTGVALKVSSINTNIFIKNTKQKYEAFLKKMIYGFLDFAKNEARVIQTEIEEPSVTIKEMNFEDYNQKVQNWISLFENKLASQLQAIQDLYHYDKEEAEALIEEIGVVEEEGQEPGQRPPKDVLVSPEEEGTRAIIKQLQGEVKNNID
ncbi:MAG: hypothetical protein ACRCTS_10355 [Fusobacteriaceae bacterium]